MRLATLGLLSILAASPGCGDDGDGGAGPDAPAAGDARVDGFTPDGGTGLPDAAPVSCDPVSGTPELELEMVQGGFTRPIMVASPPGDERLFVVEQGGTIEIVGGGTFLDITGMVECCGEEGLLGLAFHPAYATNRRFFVFYIDLGSDIQVDEFMASAADAGAADPSTRRPIISIPHRLLSDSSNRANHNGGMIAFGADGFLHISTGDGGNQDDPDENGQDTGVLLGKILRIDVDSTAAGNYGVPAGNPFGDEIWAYGLRNPWRFSVDRATGDLYIGDVGQGSWEEVDVAPFSQGGLNFGWDIYEGETCFADDFGPDGPCVTPPTDDPNVEFPVALVATGAGGAGDDRNRAIIGGYVYRGCKLPDYHGTYFYGTLNGVVRSLKWSAGSVTDERDWPALSITAGANRLGGFGEDHAGEIYVVALDAGTIYRIVPVP